MRKVTVMLMLFAGVFGQTGLARQVNWEAVRALVRATFPEVPQLSTGALAAWLADSTRTPPLLLDTRSEAEYAVSHLAGARRLDPDTPDLAALDTLDRDTPIVTYCSVGYRSSAMARRLREMGFTHVMNLEGSIFQWANEGRPVYRDGVPVRQVHPYDWLWGMLLREDLRAPWP
ncbi:MAG: sulfurtransferase [Rhodothermaceae bacterium]|nr:MAG: sulfurtransferase [Rhodothermaceae bacterium]